MPDQMLPQPPQHPLAMLLLVHQTHRRNSHISKVSTTLTRMHVMIGNENVVFPF